MVLLLLQLAHYVLDSWWDIRILGVGRITKGVDDMSHCKIQWIDKDTGKPTPDTNESVGYARCTGYPCKDNPSYVAPTSKWFPICAEHLARLPLDGHWDFSKDLPA